MSWQNEIDELHHRGKLAEKMGGPEKVARHRNNGKLTVRERIDALLDENSFHEIGKLAGKGHYDDDGKLTDFSPSNTIMGRGKISGRPVVVSGDDFTVRGGASEAAIWDKMIMAEQMARELRLPIIRLIDGTGGGGSVKTLETDQRTYLPIALGWEHVTANLGLVPVVGLALGSIAGIGAARVVASHYSMIAKGTGHLFIAGPPLVARLGQNYTKEELGGSEIHTRSGAIDDEVENEDEAFERTRQFLSYLPRSVYELPPRAEPTDDPERREEWLVEAVPRDRRKVYNMRKILKAILDKGSFFEMGRNFGRPIISGLARLDGWPVVVVASDPHFYGGGLNADAADKVTRILDLAQTFHLPVVQMIDIPGFVIGLEAEKAGTMRHGVRALAAFHQIDVPLCSVVTRRAYGVGGALNANYSRYKYRFAWPSGDWGSLPLEGGIEAAYRAELDMAEDREAMLMDIEGRLSKYRSPFRTAEHFLIEEIIDPRDTRRILCDFANLVAPLRTPGPSSFGMRP